MRSWRYSLQARHIRRTRCNAMRRDASLHVSSLASHGGLRIPALSGAEHTYPPPDLIHLPESPITKLLAHSNKAQIRIYILQRGLGRQHNPRLRVQHSASAGCVRARSGRATSAHTTTGARPSQSPSPSPSTTTIITLTTHQ